MSADRDRDQRTQANDTVVDAAHLPAAHGALPVSEAVVVRPLASDLGVAFGPSQRDERGEVCEPMS